MPRLAAFALALFAFVARAESPAPTVELVDGPEALEKLVSEEPSRPLVVHAWAAWCAPCAKELARLVPAFQKAQARGARVVLLSLDDSREREGRVPEALARAGFRDPSYLLLDVELDRVQALLDPRWNGHVPATFVLSHGKLRRAFRGPLKRPEAIVEALR